MINRCIGCGIVLQDKDELLDGYVKSLEMDYCSRCFKLKNYGEYKNTLMNNNDYFRILDSIDRESIVLYVCDIFYLNLEYLDKFNNVILVLTKRDILPKSVKDYKILKYIKDRYKNLLDVEIISSFNNYNLDNLYNKILKYKKNNYVYLVGSTNSGKSTLINKIISNYTDNNAMITTSMFPSTTLNKIEIKISDDLCLIDTPGLINNDSIINYISSSMIKRYNIKKEVKPRTFQIIGKGSIIIDNIIRVDYETFKSNSITFYINNGVLVKKIGKNNNILLSGIKKDYKLSKDMDIVIDDICFMKFVNDIKISIYLDYDINVRIRSNLI